MDETVNGRNRKFYWKCESLVLKDVQIQSDLTSDLVVLWSTPGLGNSRL